MPAQPANLRSPHRLKFKFKGARVIFYLRLIDGNAAPPALCYVVKWTHKLMIGRPGRAESSRPRERKEALN